jgi:hypothetical protein
VNSDQVILELAAEIVDVFLSLEMCKEPVAKKESRFSSRDGTA